LNKEGKRDASIFLHSPGCAKGGEKKKKKHVAAETIRRKGLCKTREKSWGGGKIDKASASRASR